MKADSITLQDFFHAERRHLVPLYQRPYVWKREAQWEPLWDDVRQLAERLLEHRPTRPHFLGAIVLDQIKTGIKDLGARLVIDGQQRLTTLQLLLGALRDLSSCLGLEDLRRKLDRLTTNEDPPPDSDQRFKVWPTNLDRAPFRALMTQKVGQTLAEKVSYARETASHDPLIVQAYAYFYEMIDAWSREAGEEATLPRLDALLGVLRQAVNLVVIDLGDDDEAQVIFETLNARGAPLLPADLVKNHLFQAAEAEGADLDPLYEKHWKSFDEGADYWRKEVKQGRFYRPQIDLFLQHYLTLATRDEVSASHLFSEFKEFAARSSRKRAEEHLRDLHSFAVVFRGFSNIPAETRRGLFFHRINVLDTSTLLPFLLGLFHRYGSSSKDSDVDRLLVDLESFLVRRMICRLTAKNYNQLFLDLLPILDGSKSTLEVADRVRDLLVGQTADSRLWPGDEMFRSAWLELPAYRTLLRARLRMILEAIEAEARTEFAEDVVLRGRLTIEHLMPQEWDTHWPLPAGLEVAAAKGRRERVIHSFGNLTLLTKKLNPSISNGPWSAKRPKILEHSALALNRWLQTADQWNEDVAEARSLSMFQLALRVWPRPTSS